MNTENFSDELKEADEVADGMIPDSQIVKILDMLVSVKDQEKHLELPVDDKSLAESL